MLQATPFFSETPLLITGLRNSRESLWVGMPRLPADAVRANGTRISGRNGGSGAVSEEPNLAVKISDL